MICSTQAFDSCEKFENRRQSDFAAISMNRCEILFDLNASEDK